MATPDFEIAVIGAGVVGLAVAAQLAKAGRSVLLVIERHDGFGRETSSRNSEVIHAGIYYAPASLKARLCVEGRDLLYGFCAEHNIPHRQCGKVIVAVNDEEVPRLEALHKNAVASGAGAVAMLSESDLHEYEPHVRAVRGLWSAQTGIIDSHALMQTLEHQAHAGDAIIQYQTEVTGITKTPDGYTLTLGEPGGESTVTTHSVVNAAGLGAERTAHMAGINTESVGYRLYPCKGEYFAVRGAASRRVNHLVYPLPYARQVGVGVHVTFDLHDRMRLGPDAFYLDAPADAPHDYAVDPAHAAAFHENASQFLPDLRLEDLTPDQSGVRPKLQGPGEEPRDFIIREESDRGLPGFVNLLGIESPGLTACLAIAQFVASLQR